MPRVFCCGDRLSHNERRNAARRDVSNHSASLASAAVTLATRRSMCGFSTKSRLPLLIAATTSGMSPWPLKKQHRRALPQAARDQRVMQRRPRHRLHAHVEHEDRAQVGEQCVDLAQQFAPVCEGADGVTGLPEREGDGVAHVGFIVHDEDGRVHASSSILHRDRHRQREREAGAAVRTVGGGEPSAMLFDDRTADAQPQAHAVALGAEERGAKFIQASTLQPGPGVADRQLARRCARLSSEAISRVRTSITGCPGRPAIASAALRSKLVKTCSMPM